MSNDRQIIEQLLDQWESAWEKGIDMAVSELCSSNPQIQQELSQKIRVLKGTDWMVQPAVATELPSLPDFDQLVIDIPIPSSLTLRDFVSKIAASGVLGAEELSRIEATDAGDLARKLIGRARLTRFQLKQIVSEEAPQLVLGNYVILDRIGAGGMGEVYKARHQRMDRLVALKILPRESVKSSSAIERFQREVKAAAKLEHPNIVTAHDAGESNGTHFLVMQLVDGQDLSYYVQQNGRMTGGKAINCILQAARGLAYAHQKGVVHRDIKPSNLFLDRDGTVKILDMGLARFASAGGVGSDPTIAKLTVDGTVIGTVDFMSPEQAIDAASVDARSDIYSLGCTLYFLMTGKSVYGGSYLMAKMLAHREAPIPSLENEEVNAVFQRMVAKKPEGRFQTAQQLIDELETLADKFLVDQEASTIELPRTDDQSFVETSSIGHAKTIELQLSKPESQRVIAKPFDLSRRWYAGGIAVALLALGAFGAACLYDIIFKIETPDGIVQIESSHPDLDVYVDGERVIYITDPNDNTKVRVEVSKGAKLLRVQKDGFEANVSEFKLKSLDGPIVVSFKPMSSSIPLVDAESQPEASEAETAAARWVWSVGGRVFIDPSGTLFDIGRRPYVKPMYIYLAETPIKDEDLKNLQGLTSIGILSLEGTGIDGSGLKFLVGIRPINLHAAKTKLNDAAMSFVADFADGATVIALSHTVISDVGLAKLKWLPTHLYINDTAITDMGVAHLASAPRSPQVLGIARTQITDAGLAQVAKMKNLQDIHMSGTRISDAGLMVLVVIPRLARIDVEETDVTPECIVQFLKIKPDCVVHDNEYAAAAGTIDAGGTVKLAGKNAPITNAIELPNGGFRVEAITLRGLARINDDVARRMANLSGLKRLELTVGALGDREMSYIATIKTLEFLDLSGTPISDDGLARLKAALPNCQITRETPK